MLALKALCQYLMDKQFELRTDNASLLWLSTQHHLSHHQACWLNLISEYEFTITHICGSANVADALSRSRHDKPAPPTLEACAVLEDLPTALPRLLRSDFAPAIRAALPSYPILGQLAQEAQD